MRTLLVIVIALMSGCASKYIAPEERVISIDTQRVEPCECECPYQHRGMKWND